MQTGKRSWGWWVKRVCLRSRGPPKSSLAPGAASSCLVSRLILIQSWSRTRHQKRTRRSLCGLCTSCYRKSSWSGAECSPWPSQVHELQVVHKDRNKRCLRHLRLNPRDKNVRYLFNKSTAYPAAPAVHSASLDRQYLAGGCGFFVSCTGCTPWLCLESVLGKPV